MIYLDQNSLTAVEEVRKKRRLKGTLGLILVLLSWVAFFLLAGPLREQYSTMLLVFAIATIPGAIIISSINKKAFMKDYKEILVRPNMSVFFQGFQYDPSGKISQDDFTRSSLFRSFNRYYGDDYMEGKLQGTPIALSDLRVSYYRSSSSSSSSSSSNIPVFTGLFLKAQLPQTLEKPVFLKPKLKVDKIPKFLHFMFSKEDLNPSFSISTGNEIFDNNFTLCCENPATVENLFSAGALEAFTMLAERVKEFNQKGQTKFATRSPIGAYPLYLSIIGNTLYFGAGGIRLFEPNYKQSIEQDKPQLELSLSILQDITGYISALVGD